MKKFTTLFLLFSISLVFSQRKYTADLYFNEFSYVKSAELYKKIYKRGNDSKHILSRLGDSYYFNSNTKEAEFWYENLFKKYENDNIATIYYFRYAQSLKSNGKYKESDNWLLKIKTAQEKDSRIQSLEKNTNYVTKYGNSKSDFTKIRNISSNSKYSDYASFLNDSIVIFSSTKPNLNISEPKLYQWNKQPFYNLYKTKILVFEDDKDIQFVDGDKVKKIPAVNSIYHDGSAIITKNGNSLYFTRDNFNNNKLKSDKNKTSHLKIYRATKINNTWANITELPFNSENYSIGHPALSTDEKTLYFSSDMPGGFGETDIYKVAIKSNNTYGNPINLGNKINTEGKEMFPYVENDSLLYFSSNGHIGLGGLDVFKSKIKANSFGKVENLKAPINSKKDDFSFIINREKRLGFFSSNRSNGKGDDDVYSFVIRKKVVVCNQALEGIVTDSFTQAILPGSKVVLFENNIKKDSTIVGLDAKYKFNITCNVKYKVKASKLFYKKSAKIFISPAISGVTIKNLQIDLEDDFQYSNGQIIVKINPIYFNYDKSNIRSDAALELNEVVRIMKKYPQLIIKSSSHTDSRGKDSYNLGLSTRRANSTVDYIISKGIDTARITGQGFGETQLVNNCNNNVKCSKEEHQLNRRTEFVVVNSSVVNKTTMNKVKKNDSIHKVKANETLFSISREYKMSVDRLKKLNGLKNNTIFIGQFLKIK